MLVIIFAVLGVGVGIGDLVFTHVTYCQGDIATTCNNGNLFRQTLTFTWISAGIWGSVFVSTVLSHHHHHHHYRRHHHRHQVRLMFSKWL